MKLSRNIIDKLNIGKYVFEKQFHSKKNRVYLVNSINPADKKNSFILKMHKDPRVFFKEIALLESLKQQGIRVPEVLYRDKKHLIMEYIDGETLTDMFERMERSGMPPEVVYPIVDSLCRWLKDFYEAVRSKTKKPAVMKDVNLRNFIFYDDKIYGIDFEEVSEGRPEEDIGKICAFLLTYSPEYTPWKLKVAKYIRDVAIKKLKLDPELVMDELINELSAIEKRRKS